jgi:hypothetical protein
LAPCSFFSRPSFFKTIASDNDGIVKSDRAKF